MSDSAYLEASPSPSKEALYCLCVETVNQNKARLAASSISIYFGGGI